MRRFLLSIAFILILFSGLWYFLSQKISHAEGAEFELRVLTYSAFIEDWGPGPLIAQEYFKSHHVRVHFIDAGDAGLLLKKMQLFKVDVVLGLDQLTADQADTKWATPGPQEIDWAPIGFIYREGEITPPKSLEDLLAPQFAHQISLPDPRASTTGLQFLYWVLYAKGYEEGFAYLQKLKSQIYRLGSSWSVSYGLFQKKQCQLTLSYFTSPIYHAMEEHDYTYRAAEFTEGHPKQIEYAAVPAESEHSTEAREFIKFLLSEEIQKQIMKKNVMLPVNDAAKAGTLFEKLAIPKLIDLKAAEPNWPAQDKILQRWQELGI